MRSSLRAGFLPLLILAASLAAPAARGETRLVSMYLSPTCGCCGVWADHMRRSGFRVEVHEVADLAPLKAENGIPPQVSSCHTAFVDGYVIEGHVPASDVLRLLAERPPVSGLAVPGMPIGSPGMEGPNPVPYDVLTFDALGRTTVFSSHAP